MDEYACSLKVLEADGKLRYDGQATLGLDDEFLHLRPRGEGEDHDVRYRDLDAFLDQDYTLLLATAERRFILSMLGKFYDGVREELRRCRRDDTIKGLLLDDFEKVVEFACQYALAGKGGAPAAQEPCDLLVFDRAVLVWPREPGRDFLKVFYSDMEPPASSDIAMRIGLNDDETLTFTMMGKRLPAALDAIKAQRAEHLARLQAVVATAFPGLASGKVAALAGLLKEGLAVPLERLAAVDPSVVRALEDGIAAAADLKDAYVFLRKRGVKGQAYAGVQVEKFGMDDQTPAFWFAVAQPEGVTAVEVVSEEGHATYFFRSEPAGLARGTAGDDGIARGARELGRALVDLRFRRTPIYLTDEELETQENARYAFAARRLPYLREVRRRFVGRVIHRSAEGWRKDVEALLAWSEAHPGGGRWPSR